MDSIDQVKQEHQHHLARFRADPNLRPGLNRPAISRWIPANPANQHPTQNYPVFSSPVADDALPGSRRSQPAP